MTQLLAHQSITKSLLIFSLLLGSVALAEPPKDGASEDASELHILTGREGHLVLSKGILAQCRAGRKLTDRELRDNLEAVTNLRLSNDSAPLDKELAIYLLAYFQVMGLKFSEPTEFKISKETSTRLVYRDKKVLIFAANASEKVFTRKVGERENLEEKSGEIQFTNTLFQQLTEVIANRKLIAKLLKQQFDINIDEAADPSLAGVTRQMTDEEAAMVFKQLLDLPTWVTQEMEIKNIVRMGAGKVEANVAARYKSKSATIQLYDLAFDRGLANGEGTLIHELGHAYWAKLRDGDRVRFAELSWTGLANPKLKANASNFVSLYSMKNPEEDFCEHFSAYVNNPEWLRKKARDKFLHFYELVFATSTYMTEADKKAKVYVESDKPDVNAPYLKGRIEDLIVITAKELADKDEIELSCVVNGLFDDISGFSNGVLGLSSKKGEHCFLRFGNSHCVDAKSGRYEFKQRINRSDFQPNEELVLDYMAMEDRAGNRATTASQKTTVIVNGTSRRVERSPIAFDPSKLKIEPVDKKDPKEEQAYRATFQIPVPEDFNTLGMYFSHATRPDYRSSLNIHFDKRSIVESADKQSFSCTFHFPKQMEAGTVSVAGVVFFQRATPKFEKGQTSFHFEKEKGVSFNVVPSAPDKTMPKAAQELLILRGIKDADGKNTRTIELTIPVDGFAQDERLTVVARVRTPSGKVLTSFDGQIERKVVDGKRLVTVTWNLAENAERGDYTLETMEISKSYSGTQGPSGSELVGPYIGNREEIKFIERGIKRTYHISD